MTGKLRQKESEAGVRLSEEMGPRLLTFPSLENTTLSMYDILKSSYFFSGQMWFGQGLHLKATEMFLRLLWWLRW